MRKFLLGASLFGLVTLPFISKGQTVYYSDSFDSDINAWTLVDSDGDTRDWYWFNTGTAAQGGVATSASWATTPLNPDNWMISPPIDLSSASGTILLTYQVYGQDQNFPDENYTVYADSSSSVNDLLNSSVSFNEVISASNGYLNRSLDLSMFAGQDSVYVAFRHHNVSDEFRINLDNVQVIEPLGNDVEVVSAAIAPNVSILDAPFDIEVMVQNNGFNTLTNFDLDYTVSGGSTVNANISGQNIPLFGTSTLNHPNSWTPSSSGTYTITVTADSPNGMMDEDPSNNSAVFQINVYDSSIQRMPLYEIFTSSTCPPCNPGNANFHNVVGNYPNEYVSIKYQQNFPGTGDPYTTDESVNRRAYYAVNSIPRMEIDGGWDGNANAFNAGLHNAARNVPAFVSLDVEYSLDVDNQSVDYCVDFEPLGNLGNATLQIAILETITEDNVKTNGETEFLEVMKKMIPNENGQPVTLTAGTPQQICGSYEFQGNYRLSADGQAANRIDHNTEHSVEDFNNLYVIAWIEDNNSLEVYQAAFGNVIQISTNDIELVSTNLPDSVQLNTAFDIEGTITNRGDVDITEYEIGYSVNSGTAITESINGVMVAPMASATFTHGTPWTPTAVGTYTVSVWTSDPNGVTDDATSNDTITQTVEVAENVGSFVANLNTLGASANIYPNPIQDNATLEITSQDNELVEISLLDVSGKTITAIGNVNLQAQTTQTIEIDFVDYESGVYLLRVTNEAGDQLIKRVVKK